MPLAAYSFGQRLLDLTEGISVLTPERDHNSEDEDEDKYADDIDMPGQNFDSKRRITVRNLRIREDIAKYGGQEHLDAPPAELLLAQTEDYVEYSRHGTVIKGQEKAIACSKYEEDVKINNHTALNAEEARLLHVKEIMQLDERKRPYNSLYETREPTEEEMEAYRMKRQRPDDPMASFLGQ
ncbi:pre-mrna-splicing factor slu7 [Limosa lapponica baueri]|uniref:Pre-mRNA-splicing factor SLU7 n=1 Tax=Limosa lapponica baueri TaxID=1758121 RepID=A0A2I0TVH9_LIMLA|nr:pre-mrna-splicing factor slu7 [Limosa lapponica baueri]